MSAAPELGRAAMQLGIAKPVIKMRGTSGRLRWSQWSTSSPGRARHVCVGDDQIRELCAARRLLESGEELKAVSTLLDGQVLFSKRAGEHLPHG